MSLIDLTLPLVASLENIIKHRIEMEGPISFRDYMDMCLYYPELGYYNSSQLRIGAQGDFYTSSNVSSAFGASIAAQLQEMWVILGEKTFTIVEIGAGTGQLCADILHYFKSSTDLFDQLEYWIVEKSPFMRQIEETKVGNKVKWFDSIESLPPFQGCILSNELLDNFPIHLVEQREELMEIFVEANNEFAEVLKPAGRELINYFTELDIDLPTGYRAEVNLDAIRWLEIISRKLERGYMLTIDYGDISSKLYTESRREGTLVCYHQHRVKGDPFKHIGEQDITAHVNFSALRLWGEKYGLENVGMTNQSNFLMSLGFKDYLLSHISSEKDPISSALRASRMANLLLIEMGDKFKVLVQSKNLPKELLRGFHMG